MIELMVVVRIRGIRNIKPRIKRTLELLRIEKPNHCVVVDTSPQTMGMLNLVKDYVAYGQVTEDTLFSLLQKRGEKGSKRLANTMSEAELKGIVKSVMNGAPVRDYADPVFRLHPPKRGLKNIKLAYPLGELGARDDINSLIKRMV
jgi:large subunit ribosomal protein L30